MTEQNCWCETKHFDEYPAEAHPDRECPVHGAPPCDSCGGTGRLYEWQPTGTVEHACNGCQITNDPWGNQ